MEDFNPSLEALKVALKKLFTDSHFSICTIDKLVEMRRIVPDRSVYQIMASVHCADYKQMSPEFRQWLFQATIDMFDVDSVEFDFENVDKINPIKRVIKLLG